MNAPQAEAILQEITSFEPTSGNWLRLDDLLVELWQVGVQPNAIPILLKVFERFPHEDGAGVLWSIVHGIESLNIPYETELMASMERAPSTMGRIMLNHLFKSRAVSEGDSTFEPKH